MRRHLLMLSVLVIIFVLFIILSVAFSHTDTSNSIKHPKPKVVSVFAMGDSISTGTGLHSQASAPLCGRTANGYPNFVASEYSATLTSRSCDGAKTTVGITEPQPFQGELQPPQLDELFAQETKPTIITLTIGTNDVEHLGCRDGDCASAEAKANFDARITELEAKLRTIFAKMKVQYKSDTPDVFATGYFAMYGDNLSCSDAAGVTREKASWMRSRTMELNARIKKVSDEFSFVHFVSINFDGHELCSKDPWIQGWGDKAAYHQNKAGSAAYARAVINAINQTLR